MSGCVMRPGLEITECDGFARHIKAVDRRRRWLNAQPEQPTLLYRPLVDEQIVAVEVDRHAERQLCWRNTGHVVDVGVRQQDVPDGNVLARDELEKPIDLIARIDQHTLPSPRTGHDKAVLVERSDGLRLDYDHVVILAILDDLMFTSKIRSAARHAGATVTFARSAEGALQQMRAEAPSLVILDLNNPRTDPLGVITAMRADDALASIPTMGYVSHVDTATIDAAREAGVGQVLARSAFAATLGEILSRSAG